MDRSKDAISLTPDPFGTGDEVGLREVDLFDLVDLNGTQQEAFIDHGHGWEREDGAGQFRHLGPLHLVERFQHVDDFGHDEVRN
jgi:hypothetical protein